MQRPALADYPAGAWLPERVLDDYELVWMVRGQALVEGELPLGLRPGELLLLPPGYRHAIRWDPDGPCRHGYVHFAAADVPGRLPPEPRVRRMTSDDPLAGLCAFLLWLAGSDRSDWLERARSVLAFTVGLVAGPALPDTEPVAPLPRALVPVIELLQVAWATSPLPRVRVGDLAAAGGLSRGHLTRQFRDHFSLSVAEALERLRCARAETLLARTDLTVGAVAEQCGYADLSHLSHRFSALHGRSPSSYRAGGPGGPSVLDHPGARRLIGLLQVQGD